MEKDTMYDDIECVKYTLNLSKLLYLEVEVVTFALKAMKENPELSIAEAITIGAEEWLK